MLPLIRAAPATHAVFCFSSSNRQEIRMSNTPAIIDTEAVKARMLVVRGQPTLLAGVVGDNLRTVGLKPFSPWYALRTAANR